MDKSIPPFPDDLQKYPPPEVVHSIHLRAAEVWRDLTLGRATEASAVGVCNGGKVAEAFIESGHDRLHYRITFRIERAP